MGVTGTDSVLESGWNRSENQFWESMNNGTVDGSETIGRPRGHERIAYASIAAIGIVGNAVVVVVIVQCSTMRKRFSNILILNQSCIDLATSVFLLLTKTITFSYGNLSGLGDELYCKFWLDEFPLWSLMLSSSYNLMALTVERYVGIVFPLFHHTFLSKTKILVLASAAWCPGPILMLCFLVPTSGVVDGRCKIMAIHASETWKKVSGVVLFIMQYLLPIFLFVACYSRMFIRLRTEVHPFGPHIGSEAAVQKARARRNLLKTLFVVVVGYLLCNSFNQLMFLAFNFGAPVDFSSYYYNLSVLAMFSNCCVNPVVYVLQYQTYQKELRKLVCSRPASA